MGKQVGIIQFNGKVGTLVGSKDSKGDMIYRAHQPVVKNPNTIKQVVARTRFLTNTALASVFKEGAIGLSSVAKSRRLSIHNVMQQVNGGAISVITSVPGEVTSEVDYTQITLSRGTAENVIGRRPGMDVQDPTKVKVSWAPLTGGNKNVFYVFYCPTLNQCRISDPLPAADGEASIPFPATWAGLEIHIYYYVQEFASEADYIEYHSYWSNYGRSLMAKAFIRQLESNANYSETGYAGTLELE